MKVPKPKKGAIPKVNNCSTDMLLNTKLQLVHNQLPKKEEGITYQILFCIPTYLLKII